MALSKFIGVTNTIQSLPDRPNQTDGLTPAQLKIKFDQFAIDSKAYYNDVMTVEIDAKDVINSASIASANTKADNAVITAGTAETKSDSSIATANTAETKADGAIVTSNSADTKADTAITTANGADTIADSALLKATNVETDYNAVKPTLLQAVDDVALKVDKTYVDQVASDYQMGVVLNDSITETKMANDMKKNIVGGVASYDAVATSLADSSTQLATGTATAITLAITTLTDLFTKTFIVSASNGGSATTINTKPLYKPNTTIAPNLTAGKAVTVWYNLANDCFFIKASATGDALVGDVLAGKTFSNDDDIGLIGTMVDRGTVNITPSTVNQAITSGKHSGSGLIYGDADLIASNILDTANIFNVQGTAIDGAGMKHWKKGAITNPGGTIKVISLTGLTFQPKYIILRCGTQTLVSYFDTRNNSYAVYNGGSSSATWVINSTGFTCTIQYDWANAGGAIDYYATD